MNEEKRIFELDVLRGVAVILMMLFHFGYDLAWFEYTSYETTQDVEWIVFRGLILSMFLLAVGMSSYLAYKNHINYDKLIKTLVKLTLVSLVISIGSYQVFEHSWIYFGVIHFITVALILSLFFVKTPNLSLVFAFLLLGSYWLGYHPFDNLFNYSVHEWNIPVFTVDLVSLSPWFALVLLGIFVMHKNMFGFRIDENKSMKKIAYLGQHSLVIYLVHQPVLFGIFYMINVVR